MVKKYLATPAERNPPKARRRYDIAGRRLLPRNGKTTAKFYSPSAFELMLHSNLKPPKKGASVSRGSSGADNKKALCDLPQELLLDLAELLPIQDLYNFAQACKRIEVALRKYLYQQQGERLLRWAASAGRRVPAQRAIQYKQNIDVNFIQSGQTALAQAIAKHKCYYGDFAGIIKLLLEQDCIDLTDATNGIPMLESALENGAHPVVDRLLKEGRGKINHILDNGQTPLMTAACNGHKDVVDLLIQRGADVNQRTSSSDGPIGSRRTALALVIQKHRPRNVGILWQQDDDLVSVAKLLLEQEDIDLTDETNGIPMLETAIGKGFVAVVDQLLEERQDNIDILFENGQTPLITASRHGQRHIVDLLICRGADVNQRTGPITGLDEDIHLSLHKGFGGDTWTALAMASRHGHDDVVRRLLECETIDTDVVAKETETPVSSWRLSLDELTQEPHERKPFSRQGSALFWAVVQGRPRCVLALLQSHRVSLSTEELTRLQNVAKSVPARSTEAELEGVRSEMRCIRWLFRQCKGIDETDEIGSRLAKLQGVTASTLEEVGHTYLIQDLFVSCGKIPRRGKSTPSAAGKPAITWSRRRQMEYGSSTRRGGTRI